MANEESGKERAARWVGKTSGIAGGAALGGAVAGPVGALGGAIAGEALKTAFGEMASRALSAREDKRVKTVASLAEREISNEIAKGRRLRDDDFFDRNVGGEDRSAADEVFEGVFSAAKAEHEERKIPLIARMMARFAFSPTIDRYECNFMTRVADELSYRQYCLLALFNLTIRDQYNLRTDLNGNPWTFEDDDPKIAILQEVLDLYRRTMVQQKSLQHDGTDIILEVTTIAPGQVQLVQGPGALLARLMDLPSAVSPLELQRLAQHLR